MDGWLSNIINGGEPDASVIDKPWQEGAAAIGDAETRDWVLLRLAAHFAKNHLWSLAREALSMIEEPDDRAVTIENLVTVALADNDLQVSQQLLEDLDRLALGGRGFASAVSSRLRVASVAEQADQRRFAEEQVARAEADALRIGDGPEEVADRCNYIHLIAAANARSGRIEHAAELWQLAIDSALRGESAGVWECSKALARIAEAMAPHLPEKALRVAESISEPTMRNLALERCKTGI